MPIDTVAIKETIDQTTPVMESWFFSKIAGIHEAALIMSTKINVKNKIHPGFNANSLDKNSPKAKNIAEMLIQAQKGIIVNINI